MPVSLGTKHRLSPKQRENTIPEASGIGGRGAGEVQQGSRPLAIAPPTPLCVRGSWKPFRMSTT